MFFPKGLRVPSCPGGWGCCPSPGGGGGRPILLQGVGGPKVLQGNWGPVLPPGAGAPVPRVWGPSCPRAQGSCPAQSGWGPVLPHGWGSPGNCKATGAQELALSSVPHPSCCPALGCSLPHGSGPRVGSVRWGSVGRGLHGDGGPLHSDCGGPAQHGPRGRRGVKRGSQGGRAGVSPQGAPAPWGGWPGTGGDPSGGPACCGRARGRGCGARGQLRPPVFGARGRRCVTSPAFPAPGRGADSSAWLALARHGIPVPRNRALAAPRPMRLGGGLRPPRHPRCQGPCQAGVPGSRRRVPMGVPGRRRGGRWRLRGSTGAWRTLRRTHPPARRSCWCMSPRGCKVTGVQALPGAGGPGC